MAGSGSTASSRQPYMYIGCTCYAALTLTGVCYPRGKALGAMSNHEHLLILQEFPKRMLLIVMIKNLQLILMTLKLTMFLPFILVILPHPKERVLYQLLQK